MAAKEYLERYFENECNKLAKQGKFPYIIADLLYLTRSFATSYLNFTAAKILLPHSQVIGCCLFTRVKASEKCKYAEAQTELSKLFLVETQEAKLIEAFNKKLDAVSTVKHQMIAGAIKPLIVSIIGASGVTGLTTEPNEIHQLREENQKLRYKTHKFL